MTTVADLVHARFYGDVLSVSDLLLAPALSRVLPSILQLLRVTDLVYYLDILVGCAILTAHFKRYKRAGALEILRPMRVSAVLILSGLLLAGPAASMMWKNRGEFSSYTTVRVEAAASVGIVPYHLGDMIAHLHSDGSDLNLGLSARVYQFLMDRDKQRASRSSLAGIARGHNVIVISAESLQAFPIGLRINGQAVMPRLAAFAKESLNFVNFYDQTHLARRLMPSLWLYNHSIRFPRRRSNPFQSSPLSHAAASPI